MSYHFFLQITFLFSRSAKIAFVFSLNLTNKIVYLSMWWLRLGNVERRKICRDVNMAQGGGGGGGGASVHR